MFNMSLQCACVQYCVHSQYVHCMDHNCFADCILFAMHTHRLESGTYTGSLFLILIWCGTTRFLPCLHVWHVGRRMKCPVLNSTTGRQLKLIQRWAHTVTHTHCRWKQTRWCLGMQTTHTSSHFVVIIHMYPSALACSLHLPMPTLVPSFTLSTSTWKLCHTTWGHWSLTQRTLSPETT